MGCASSKLFAKEIRQENLYKNRDYTHHVVSLTSSTYGVLSLEKDKENLPEREEVEVKKNTKDLCFVEVKKTSPSRDEHEPLEMINAWELMEGLEEECPVVVVQSKKSPQSRILLRGIEDGELRSPLTLLNQVGTPKKVKKVGGKENKGRISNGGTKSLDNTPKTFLKESNKLKKQSPRLWASIKGSPNLKRCDSFRLDSGGLRSSRRRNLGPLFDPELVASFEKELSEEEDKMKKMVAKKARKSHDSDSILNLYKKKCPPGGENTVVVYTTTLRGIRKTFEDCNAVRSIIESQDVQMFERDISMHSTFKEELRGLMGNKNVRVPMVFVKGRLIGGVAEMVKLEEEGKLEILLQGIPEAGPVCMRCAGVRFLLCTDCNGSCRVLGEDKKKSVKCSHCNENGLVQCPFCS